MTPRRATPPDAASIHEIELLAAHKPWALADVHTHLAMPHGVTWVASHGVHIVGHVLATALFEEGEIFSVAVHPAHRRQGLARALLQALHEDWRQRGVQRGFLEVRDDNKGAQGLYTTMGWRSSGRRANYYSDGADAVLMSWETT